MSFEIKSISWRSWINKQIFSDNIKKNRSQLRFVSSWSTFKGLSSRKKISKIYESNHPENQNKKLTCAMQIFLTAPDNTHRNAMQQWFNIRGWGVLRPRALLVKWPINHKPCWEPVSVGLGSGQGKTELCSGEEQGASEATPPNHSWDAKQCLGSLKLLPSLAKQDSGLLQY